MMIILGIKKYNMISALSSGKIDKYGYYIGDEILTSNQNRIIEQTKKSFDCLKFLNLSNKIDELRVFFSKMSWMIWLLIN